jgi:hypothetical protein
MKAVEKRAPKKYGEIYNTHVPSTRIERPLRTFETRIQFNFLKT